MFFWCPAENGLPRESCPVNLALPDTGHCKTLASPSTMLRIGKIFTWCCNYTLCANFLWRELRKPARRRSLPLATQQKSFLCISDFARTGFFLLKGKENFFAGFCSERAGRRDWPLFFARTRRNSPHTPLPPCSCGDGRDFWRRHYL